MLENAVQLRHVQVEVEFAGDFPATGLAEPLPRGGIADQLLQSGSERVHIAGRNEHAVHAAGNEFGNARHRCADAGNFHGHGFHQRDRNAFGKAGQDKNVGAAQDFHCFGLRQRAGERDGLI